MIEAAGERLRTGPRGLPTWAGSRWCDDGVAHLGGPYAAIKATRSRSNASRRLTFKAKQKPERAASARSRTTKQDRVLSLLRSQDGATIAAIMKVTG